jgi:hypothetical protein
MFDLLIYQLLYALGHQLISMQHSFAYAGCFQMNASARPFGRRRDAFLNEL